MTKEEARREITELKRKINALPNLSMQSAARIMQSANIIRLRYFMLEKILHIQHKFLGMSYENMMQNSRELMHQTQNQISQISKALNAAQQNEAQQKQKLRRSVRVFSQRSPGAAGKPGGLPKLGGKGGIGQKAS